MDGSGDIAGDDTQPLTSGAANAKWIEAICVEVIGVPYPRNRRERRRVLHAMRQVAS